MKNLILTSLFTFLFFLFGCATKTKTHQLPNIVIILADDMGYGDVQALNPESRIPTPNLNRIAKEGITFTDAHTNSAVCTPTRYGLLTGRYCWRSRLKRGVMNGYGEPLIEKERPTIASSLKLVGYNTGIVGKWHLGLGFVKTGEDQFDFSQPLTYSPNDVGFDYSYVIPASLDFPPYVYIQDKEITEFPSDSVEKNLFPAYWREGERSPAFIMEETLDHLVAKANGFIEENVKKENPFFLYFPLTAPHKPVLPHKRFVGTTELGPYGDFVHQVDWTVGEVLKKLDELEINENTLVIYTSDNGSFMYRLSAGEAGHVEDETIQAFNESNHTSNYVFRGTKADIWEAGHHVPFFVRWPKELKPDVKVGNTICVTDIFATLADITGVELIQGSAQDSYSFYPLLKNKENEYSRPPVIHHSAGGVFAIRSGDWKLVLGNGSGGREQPRGKPFEKPYQLFNLKDDLVEKNNVLEEFPERAEKLEKMCLEIKEGKGPVLKQESHSFSMDSVNFLLDGKPFQIIAGEIHYSRIPKEYWRHRIQMVKAMGCNTIASYVFWNYHETTEGVFDFTSGNRNLPEFIEIVKEEGMWLLFRPGPYSCGEWDLGGIPPYLLRIPDIKLRCMDSRYMQAVEKYIDMMSEIISPHLITNGGPIILLQIENEYGSYGNDKAYMKRLKELWEEHGIDVPYYTSDGATTYMLEAGTLPGVAVGLDPGANQRNFDLSRQMNPGVPVFSSETYPGWLTHWKETWQRPDTARLLSQVRFLLENNLSFNFYVLHGGTNFGFTAGANSGGHGYQPDVTSYDYDAPINEQGRATHKYYALQNILRKYRSDDQPMFPQPEPIPIMEIPEVEMKPFTSVWNTLPSSIKSVQPKPLEYFDQNYGFALYKTRLIGRKKGKLTITDLHDYATIFVDGKYVGSIDRSEGENSIELPESDSKTPVLEIFVEAMGRINFAQQLIDRKGITERVTLNGMTLMNWDIYSFPMDSEYINSLSQSDNNSNPGIFFKGEFSLAEVADTYIDMSNYTKGVVWVNGHNLGRYWNVGPQHSLYCPAPWLKQGTNEIIVFDLHQLEPKPVKGIKELI